MLHLFILVQSQISGGFFHHQTAEVLLLCTTLHEIPNNAGPDNYCWNHDIPGSNLCR